MAKHILQVIVLGLALAVSSQSKCTLPRQERSAEKISILANVLQNGCFKKQHQTPLLTRGQNKFIYCMIPKCSSSKWKRLILKAQGTVGYYGKDPHIPKYYKLLAAYPSQQVEKILSNASIPSFVLVRNPYIRFLSTYLDKVKYVDRRRGIYIMQVYQLTQEASFTDFARAFDRQQAKVGSAELLYRVDKKQLRGYKAQFTDQHLALQSTFCGQQVGMQFDYVLRLEEIEDWYDCLVEKLGIEELVRGGWPGPGDCFFYSEKLGCNKTETNDHHSHSADDFIHSYYTPEIVNIVNKWYRRDFEKYGYYMWDGDNATWRITESSNSSTNSSSNSSGPTEPATES